MDNFSVFDQAKLALVIEPFLQGVTPHITPIAYRAWTPDIFLFLFCATNQYDEDHFFASISYDYLKDGKDSAAKILKQWNGLEVVEFIHASRPVSDENVSVQVDSIYKAYLARVKRPRKLGYWSNYIVITRKSNVDKELADVHENTRKHIKAILADNRHHSVNVYKYDSDGVELFYS